MTTADAFLADIVANPADDAPRLIYADYLDDEGDAEQARFIRLQCEIAKYTFMQSHTFCHHEKTHNDIPCPLCCRCQWCIMREEEYELWRLHGFRFSEHLPGASKAILAGNRVHGGLGDSIAYIFRRGFVHSMQCRAGTFMGYAPVMEKTPLREVRLTSYVDTGILKANWKHLDFSSSWNDAWNRDYTADEMQQVLGG